MKKEKTNVPKPLRKVTEWLRTAKGHWCVLPDFIIAGAQKAGTASLYSYLIQHPQVIHGLKREIHYFDMYYKKGISWYRGHFPPASRLRDKAFITGESTPYYMFHPHALQRLYSLLPHIKLIILLRDPVRRAISHYFHEVRRGREPLSIEEAFKNEEKRIEPEYEKMLRDEYYHSQVYQHYSYKKRGIYVDQILDCFEKFPSDQILVLKSEDFFSDPKKILREVFIHLDINPEFVPSDLSPRNVGNYAEKVSDSVIDYLREYFAPHNERLYKYLNRDFQW
jgi:hypothetical protein